MDSQTRGPLGDLILDIKLPVGQRSCSAGSNASPVGDGWKLEDQPVACESSAGVAGEWGRSSDSGWVRDSFTRRAEQSESNGLQKKSRRTRENEGAGGILACCKSTCRKPLGGEKRSAEAQVDSGPATGEEIEMMDITTSDTSGGVSPLH